MNSRKKPVPTTGILQWAKTLRARDNHENNSKKHLEYVFQNLRNGVSKYLYLSIKGEGQEVSWHLGNKCTFFDSLTLRYNLFWVHFFHCVRDWLLLQKQVFAAVSISEEPDSACVGMHGLPHSIAPCFSAVSNMVQYHSVSTPSSLYPKPPSIFFRNREDEINLTWKKICYKVCCEIESLFVDRLSNLTQIEWWLWENMQHGNQPAMLSICSSLIDQGQNVSNSFWGVTKIIDKEDYLIQEPYQEMQLLPAVEENNWYTCKWRTLSYASLHHHKHFLGAFHQGLSVLMHPSGSIYKVEKLKSTLTLISILNIFQNQSWFIFLGESWKGNW